MTRLLWGKAWNGHIYGDVKKQSSSCSDDSIRDRTENTVPPEALCHWFAGTRWSSLHIWITIILSPSKVGPFYFGRRYRWLLRCRLDLSALLLSRATSDQSVALRTEVLSPLSTPQSRRQSQPRNISRHRPWRVKVAQGQSQSHQGMGHPDRRGELRM